MNQVNQKTLQLVSYLLSRCGSCDFWKILKLLYFIDFEHYYRFKESVTGQTYYHFKHGPVPSGWRYKEEILEAGQKLNLWRIYDDFQMSSQLDCSNLSAEFSQTQKLTIEYILSKYDKLNGKELRALSHEDEPWKYTELEEEIKYEYVFFREEKIRQIGSAAAKNR